MTALLADPAVVSPVLPHRPQRGADRFHTVSGDATILDGPWVHRPAAAAADAGAPVGPVSYQLTERGIAVVLALIVAVVGAMAATLVVAFLAVSDAPPASPSEAVAVAAPLAAHS